MSVILEFINRNYNRRQVQAFQKEKEIIAIHIPSKGTFCCFKPHKWLKAIKLWAVTEIGALSMEISEQTWSRTQLHNSYLAVYTFLWSKPNSDEKKSLKRFLSPHAPLHVYTVQSQSSPIFLKTLQNHQSFCISLSIVIATHVFWTPLWRVLLKLIL